MTQPHAVARNDNRELSQTLIPTQLQQVLPARGVASRRTRCLRWGQWKQDSPRAAPRGQPPVHYTQARRMLVTCAPLTHCQHALPHLRARTIVAAWSTNGEPRARVRLSTTSGARGDSAPAATCRSEPCVTATLRRATTHWRDHARPYLRPTTGYPHGRQRVVLGGTRSTRARVIRGRVQLLCAHGKAVAHAVVLQQLCNGG